MNVAVRHISGPLGIAELKVARTCVAADPSGAAYLPDQRALIVSDLHLEKGAAFARRGMMLPPYDTAATLARLEEVIARHDPSIVVCLGDSFHDRLGSSHLPPMFRENLSRLMRGRDWVWIAGNHDPDMPVGLGGEARAELELGGLHLRHEPSADAGIGEVAGHLHPGARIVRRGRSVRRRCFASNGARLIMPAFGAYTGTLNVLDRAYAGLFEAGRLTAYMLGADRVYAICGSRLQRG